ncbi:amino acid adenylation domain-containing protein [bacterium]|nr:amino acid adenylation domain-containing protein [bacterium]
MAELTERIETARTSDEGLQTYPLQAVSRDQDLPLSFAQERLWFLHHLEPDSLAYSLPRGIRFKGVLSKDALEKTYVELARRHETLRTTFHSTDGNPVLRIAAEPNIVFDTLDLRHLPGVEREAEVKRLSKENAHKPFDLTRGPLFRIQLFQLEDEEHVLHFNMHHIISDQWSLGVMAREIATLYTAFIKGNPADLPELPVQYADYAVWQRQWLQGEALEAQLNYWKDKLGGELPVLELPTDRPRPAVQTHRGAIESLTLPKELTDALQAMSRREGVTLFMTLLAAFKTLLYLHTGQEDTIVGTPIAGRSRTELEGLIGFFMNTIVMRTDLAGQPSFRELLGRVRETALGAYAHQDMPFEKLVEELSPERDLSRTPLFQVFFNHIVTRGAKAADLPGLESEAIGGLDRESKFDMTLYVFEGQGGIKLRLAYNTDLFDASTITWMLDHFETLLEGIADDPDQCISVLPLLTRTTRQQLSTKGNTIQPTKSFANIKAAEIDQSLHGRFMQQVKSFPDNIAVKTRKYEWTYAELNLEANRIAQSVLTECGDKEERIALLFGHDAPMIASIIGALKAGKTYVPLDPSYPVERLAYILEDSNARAVLTDSLNVDLAEALTREKVQLINIDDQQSTPAFENVEVSVTPEALAYILYTSGSTGRPKGVMQNHRNVMHFIRVYTNNLHISEDDRLTLISSYSFDGAIMDIFGALLNGSTLYPINIKEETAESILQWLMKQEITLYHSTPTVYRYILSYLDNQNKFSKMRLVVLGGEEVFRRDVELYKRHFEPDCIFINGLGPSESTVTLQYLINGHTTISRTAVPVGYPVDETEILLLTDTGEAAEVYGEIAIRSPHIALGYWQQPELTNKVFLPDPERGNKRIYRSGDMGRLLPDGSIEFAGRKDSQIKIRGFRIEVGEIEVVLGQYPVVGEAVVVPGEDSHGDRQLVAYLAIDESPPPSISEIRSFLQQKLPEYMIPSAFVFLDALPRTPNGKVDHRALPGPDLERLRRETKAEALVAPRDALELQLTEIWEKVLGVKNIGMKDNFFDLGGHSLLAVNLFARIQKIFGKDLPLNTLFQAPTIGQLARIIRQEGFSAPWSSLAPIQHGGSKPPFFCVHGCTGKILFFYDLARFLGLEQPFYGLSALGLEKGQVPHDKIEDMATHYIKEIRTVQINGPYFIGASGAGCTIALEMAHQLESQGQHVALIVLMAPAHVKPIISSTKLHPYYRYLNRHLRIYFRLLNILIKSRPRIPLIKSAFFNRVLWPWKIFHRFIPIEIHRFHRFLDALGRARLSYTPPQAYHGRITCFLREEFSHDHKKAIGDWYEIAVGGLDVRFVPGTILSMWQEPHVQILAEKLIACLNEAQKNS